MLYCVLGVVVTYFGRLLLDRYTDLANLGVYSFFLMLTLQVNGLWSSFNRAWTPEIFSKFLEDRKKAIENVEFMVFFSSFVYLLAIAAFIIIGKLFLFKLLFKEIYLSNIYLFFVLLLVPLFTGIYMAAYPLYYYENRTKMILLITILLSGITIFLTLFMVRLFGSMGAALAFFVVTMLTPPIYFFAFKKIMQIPSRIINFSLFIAGLMLVNVVIFLKTSSSVLFLIFIIFGVALAYKMGNLSKKKYLFFDFLRNIWKVIKPMRVARPLN